MRQEIIKELELITDEEKRFFFFFKQQVGWGLVDGGVPTS